MPKTKFLPSKYHTLDDKEFTAMLEPYPGTQVIYEHFGDCPTLPETWVNKVYPPNTTLIVNNPCWNLNINVFGEITKLVVERNYGGLYLGSQETDGVYTKEVVIKSNDNWLRLNNNMDRVEIQENTSEIGVFGRVAEQVDVKKTSGILWFMYENFAA